MIVSKMDCWFEFDSTDNNKVTAWVGTLSLEDFNKYRNNIFEKNGEYYMDYQDLPVFHILSIEQNLPFKYFQ